MLLTPANAQRLADELAGMRGAAMKLGQMLSMDSGDFLPKQLADILARLRSDGITMPPEQLNQTMVTAYGEDWEELFYGFDFKPLAAASIGQVHRAYSPDGREIVLKIQYPGVAKSIDSDVNNISTLLRISGLLPEGVKIDTILEDAKAQLKDEANYLKEAEHLASFGELLAEDERFVIPEVLEDLTTEQVLAMTYVPGQPIEDIGGLPQAERDRVMNNLLDLMLREFFELRLVQTDPNFANYFYQARTGQIVLLDFGATRRFEADFVKNYKGLIRAAIARDDDRILAAAIKVGYLVEDADPRYCDLVIQVFNIALEPFATDGTYDFGGSNLTGRLAKLAENFQEFRHFKEAWHLPPTDAAFFHRKIGGMYLLASRMGAHVNMRELVRQWL